ncbi:PKD domain-containing protein, partial [Blastococcus sp. SYSU DS0616]
MSASLAAAPKKILAGVMAAALGVGVFAVLPPGVAAADSAPTGVVGPANPTTVTADALPTAQIDGVAWSQAVVGNTVYVGGSFSSARPAGAAPGERETTRSNLLAYDIRTGELIESFAPTLNGQVLVVAASPDGSRLYVGGDFTEVDGQVRRRAAAFDIASGTLVANWKPTVNSQVRAIAATDDTVYLGGSITAVGGVSRSRLAAVTAADGSLLPWAPQPGVGPTSGNSDGNRGTSDQVMALVVTGNGHVVAGGRFDSMNGAKATGVTTLDPVSGETRPFAINEELTNQGINSAVYSLSTDGNVVYGTAYDFYGPGNLEGSFAAAADGGEIIAINDCRGDSYSSYPMHGALYVAGHPHDCENIGGFEEQQPRTHRYGVAFSVEPTGVTGSHWIENSNLSGQPAGALLNWFPSMTPGTFTGQGQAGWHVTGDGEYVVYAGEFPRVNGVGQQGLVRYAMPDTAPNRVGPSGEDFTATATSPVAGQVTVSWRATSDQDNSTLTYAVYREGEESPVAETTATSTWWDRPMLSATDPGVSGSLRYRVTATDPFGNSVATDWVAVDVAPGAGAGTSSYQDLVRADGARSHWRLGEASGSTAADSVGADPMTAGAGVRPGAEAAVAGDTAYSFDGTASATLATGTRTAAPSAFTQEAWIRTTSPGRVMGFGDARTGSSSTYDRQVWVDEGGRLNFGVNARFLFWYLPVTVTSSEAYDDGQWHHVAATLDSQGMALYVDGELVASRSGGLSPQPYSGYLRVGSDRAMGGASTFTGEIDEVALYQTALSAERVAAHAGAAGGSNLAPLARFTSTVTDLAVGLDGSGSVDADGTVTGHTWDFGDGTTATGPTAMHSYAEAGSYVITLAVTDDGGATRTAARVVTVAPAPPNQAPSAAFTATADGLELTVDGSGATDVDGTVTGHAWSFGDGTTGTGAAATHTYPAPGSYRVTLAVTDDDGAVSVAERLVVVTAPVSSELVAKDTFGRTVTGGLGTADVGGEWITWAGSARLSVTPGAATFELPGVRHNTGAYLDSVSQTSADVVTSFSPTTMPTGGGTYLYVTGRRVASGEEYRVRVRVLADGRVALALSRLTGGTEAFPGGEVFVPGLTWTEGTSLLARVEVSGTGSTAITGRVWAEGAPEPEDPQLTATDSTPALQAAGSVGLTAHRPASTTAATAVRVSSFQVLPVGAGQVTNTAPVAAFTATTDGLTVSVDGTMSVDPDGSVTGFAWDFGDGVPGTGATATHGYAVPGTYPVTLTVTDDSGASSNTKRQVQVTAPAEIPVVAGDAFGRTVSGGLGTADVGGAWTAWAGASRLSVSPGVASFELPGAGHNTGAYLGGVSAT